MALDSKAKRFAVPGVARPWMRTQYPDAALGREARASIGNAYPVANFQNPGGGPSFQVAWAVSATRVQSMQGMS